MDHTSKVKRELETAESSAQKCSICDNAIPADVERISFKYKNRYGYAYKRVCGYCIITAGKLLNKDPIKKWEKKLVTEAI